MVAAVADLRRFVKELGSTNPLRKFLEIAEVAGRWVAASGHSAAGRTAAEASSCCGELADTAENSAEEVSTVAAAVAAVANRDYSCRTHDRWDLLPGDQPVHTADCSQLKRADYVTD